MDYEYLRVERGGPVATVTFDRPDKANALNHDLLAEIERAALSFQEDTATRVVIFTGAGRHFSAGADLAGMGRDYGDTLALRRRRRRIGERAIEAIRRMDAITIAAWNGAAIGGGGCLALAADLRVGAVGCFLRFPEVDLGLNLSWKAMPLCVQLAGPAKAKRLLAGGEQVGSETLLQWGILDALAPPDALIEAAREMAGRYAAKPPLAAQTIKRSINAYVSALDQAVMHMDVDQYLLLEGAEDRQQAVEAYIRRAVPGLAGR